ncbi:MAG: hypothetical protein SP1CHLAM54_14190 [Chlamydiia bacterium]|nr:hypothetical protein [Chlamydiia bacterium]MCH9616311.1 hypothetical protein [Chlamydiia bacterium]MCH9629703.1 hypothetical protein [Chlamydiia bacterium]
MLAETTLNPNDVQEKLERICVNFHSLLNHYLLFHALFAFLMLVEVGVFSFLLSTAPKSIWLGLTLATMVLTGFTYFVLLFYYQTKKPEQMIDLQEGFIRGLRENLPAELDQTESLLSVAQACHRGALEIDENFSGLDKLPLSLRTAIKRLSHRLQKEDVRQMKRLLLKMSIHYHIQLIKHEPSDIEAHSSLAKSYLVLGRLIENGDRLVLRAIQEYLIIQSYAPNDPWVFAQLATCYQKLGEREKQAAAYETILRLCPRDKEIMFRLGMLYFEMDETAKGLRLYGMLRELNFSKSEELINYYGGEETL